MPATGTGTSWQLNILDTRRPSASSPFQVWSYGSGIIVVVRQHPPKVVKALHIAPVVVVVYC